MNIQKIQSNPSFLNILKRIKKENIVPVYLETHNNVPVFDISNNPNKTKMIKYIYGDLNNEYIYVGITKQGWKIRNSGHTNGFSSSFIDQQLKTNHLIVLFIVDYSKTVEELSIWENRTINNLHCCVYDDFFYKGYNKSFGGDLGLKFKYSEIIFKDQSKSKKSWIKQHPVEYAEFLRKAALAKQSEEWKSKARKTTLNWISNHQEDFNKFQKKAKATKNSPEYHNAQIKRNKHYWTNKNYVLNQILKHQGKIKMTCEKDIFDFVNEVNSKLYIGQGFSVQARKPLYNGITPEKLKEKFIACSKYCNIVPIWTSKMYALSAFGMDEYLYNKVFKWRKSGKSFKWIKEKEYANINRGSFQLAHQYELVCKRNNWPEN